MGFIWFLLGLVIGLLVAWFFLSARYRKDLAEHEASWGAKLRASHEETAEARGRLAAAEATAQEAKAQEDAATSRAAAFEQELTASRDALEEARLLANERGDKLSAAKTEAEELRGRLANEASARAGLEQKLAAQPAVAGPAEADRAEETRLRGAVAAGETRIRELEAQLAQAQAERTATPASEPTTAAAATPESNAEEAPALTLKRYPGEDGAAGDPDDLTRIKGIGAVLKGKLNGLGITTFQQIAGFTAEDIERINAVLDFPGRIEREKWVEQARDFMR